MEMWCYRDASTPAPAAPASGPMDLNTAIQEVLKHAEMSDGLARGIRKAVQALDRLVDSLLFTSLVITALHTL